MDRVTARKKWENYWYYYKYQTLIGIFVIFVVVYSIITSIGTKGQALNVTVLGTRVNDTELSNLQDEATKLFVTNPKEEIGINFYYFSMEDSDQISYAVRSKLLAETAAGTLDILIADRDIFMQYAKQGMFLRLDTIDELPGLTDGNFKLVKAGVDSSGQEYPYGIDMEDNERLKGIQYDTENKVLGIIANTGRKELSLKFVKWLLKL